MLLGSHRDRTAPTVAVERTNAFNRLQRRYERNEEVIDVFFDLAAIIITVCSLILQARTLYRWESRLARRP